VRTGFLQHPKGSLAIGEAEVQVGSVLRASIYAVLVSVIYCAIEADERESRNRRNESPESTLLRLRLAGLGLAPEFV
jgi:hypothetical protein